VATQRRRNRPRNQQKHTSQPAEAASPRRSTWDKTRASLLECIGTRTARCLLQAARLRHLELNPFEDPAALLQFLSNRAADDDAKDALYRRLIRLARSEPAQPLWSSLIWLGLWPGLDAAFFNSLRSQPGNADEVISELTDRLFGEIHNTDLGRVDRLACTLVWNIGRDLIRLERRRKVHHGKHSCLEVLDTLPLPGGSLPFIQPDRFIQRDKFLRLEDLPVTGDEFDLVVRVVAGGDTQQEIASDLGLRPDAVRKRYQRALSRLRQHVAEKVCPTRPGQMASTSRTRRSP
jgi:DNA-directed RNA polymerase specialized sigma24 family protein